MTELPSSSRNTILVVDDTPANIEVLHGMLNPDYELLFATNGEQGLELAAALNPDLILLDIRMPGLDGFEVCRRLKEDLTTRHIPVIFLTAMNDEGYEEAGLQAGAIDYISKPYNQAVVRKRLANQLALKRYQDMLENLAWIDGLTNLPNRRQFDRVLEREWQRAMRTQTPLSLIMVDLDHFKRYNDSYGHLAGDDCLKTVAKTLKQTPSRATDLVCRYGGEEFVCILPGTDHAGVIHVAQRMLERVQKLKMPHALSSFQYVTISLGIHTVTPQKGTSALALVEAADKALYRAKIEGRNRIL